ncbi:LysR family transcriptional regulator [Brachybacterium paraconglomeratum]|uniref:LysR family transcriptional regulator n=1 Tax=Brachybacterium paraconglomeratum TaxID=173362 RepID=UPI00223A7621|nr:LysR family transcriptional regulator [Brachybacterium paraconglomeratum]MCT1436246.1 LysR family transcriptional regulator [Brachybacterium paraconglomeratum]
MTLRLKVEDLVLVEAVSRHGSVGAAAKELLSTQPSASRRLAALERRLGTRLFERDTTGARPTPAGRELARRAANLLADLDALPAQIAAATQAPSLSLGTIQALAPIVFTAAQIELAGLTLQAEVDHGPTLIGRVHQGLLDAAIVTISDQAVLPHGLQATVLGTSPLVLVLPADTTPLAAGKKGFAGRDVLYSSIDLAGEHLHAGLSALGAIPQPGPTIETTLRMARHRKIPAVVPDLAARWWDDPGDRRLPSPVPGKVTLSLVTRPPQPPRLAQVLPALTARILSAPQDSQDGP